jgi:hypothetical protein
MNTTTEDVVIVLSNGSLLNSSMTATKLSKFSHENQQCSACPERTYIIDPNKDVCQSCPKGESKC